MANQPDEEFAHLYLVLGKLSIGESSAIHSDCNGVVRELTYIETKIDFAEIFHEWLSFPSLRPQADN